MLIRIWLQLPSHDSLRAMVICESHFDLMLDFVNKFGGRVMGVESIRQAA